MNIEQSWLTSLFHAPRNTTALHWRHGPCPRRIEAELHELRLGGRRSIRMLDLGCGSGERLLHAAKHARALGFVAIEGRGVDLSPLRIRHARQQARVDAHPSTILQFDMAEAIQALAAEHDGAADLIFLSQPLPYPSSPLAQALDRVSAGPVLVSE